MSLRRPTAACFVSYFCYKPFMWCHPDARLRHYYSCSFLSRSHSDPRLAPVLLFLQFPLEESFRPSFGTRYLFLGFREDYRPTSLLFSHALLSLCLNALVNLFICIMFTFVISYVRTVLRVLSWYSPGLLIWPDVDEGDLMDDEFDSESDA